MLITIMQEEEYVQLVMDQYMTKDSSYCKVCHSAGYSTFTNKKYVSNIYLFAYEVYTRVFYCFHTKFAPRIFGGVCLACHSPGGS